MVTLHTLDGKCKMGKSVYETLSGINVGQYVKELQKNKYIAWSDAWGEVKKIYPLATYTTHEDEKGNPFFVSDMGIFVKVTVHIEDEKQTHFYPVMNGANKALKKDAYSYKVKKYEGVYPNSKFMGNYEDKYVEPATAFDINTAIMRGLTKCLALMGMALYIYRDELMPEPPLLDSTELQEVLDAIKASGLKLKFVTDSWQIEKIAHLHSSNFSQMMDWIAGQPK